MNSTFWLKGFYFERRVFFYNSLKVGSLLCLKGISLNFYFKFFSRLIFFESFSTKTLADKFNTYSIINRKPILTIFNRIDVRIILVNLLLTSFPVFLEYSVQQRSNIWKHFLMRSKKGLFLKISKPLGRKTRARTFLKKHQTKRLVSEKPSRIKRATANWF